MPVICRYSYSLAATLFAVLICVVGAQAQSRDKEQVGWTSDVEGLRHFSGMKCPDIIGGFFRSKVLAADADRMAGCVYTGKDGMTAVLRQHFSGTGVIEAQKFIDSFKASGFRQIALTGVAQSGTSFQTRSWSENTLCETLWHFSGKKADYTLWMSYTLPNQEGEIGSGVAAFTEALTRQN